MQHPTRTAKQIIYEAFGVWEEGDCAAHAELYKFAQEQNFPPAHRALVFAVLDEIAARI